MHSEHTSPDVKVTTSVDTDLNNFSAFLAASHELPKGEPNTYGATPLDRMVTLQQQLELARELQELTYRNIPDDVPIELIDYVHTTFAARFHSRAEANEENYMTALVSKDAFASDESILSMFERGELGQASPSELLKIRELRGIRSVELACLTHPYGERITQLPEMREVVSKHVELLGGSYYEDPTTRYRVKEFVGQSRGSNVFEEGVLMTRKRTLGLMPDGTIIRERSSFVLRLDDASPFSAEEISKMKAVDTSKPNWQQELTQVGQLDEAAKILLDSDEFSLAIPISSTIYAYNPATARVIEERNKEASEARRALFAQQHPVISAAMNSQSHTDQRSVRVAEDRSGIFYVGPTKFAKPNPNESEL